MNNRGNFRGQSRGRSFNKSLSQYRGGINRNNARSFRGNNYAFNNRRNNQSFPSRFDGSNNSRGSGGSNASFDRYQSNEDFSDNNQNFESSNISSNMDNPDERFTHNNSGTMVGQVPNYRDRAAAFNEPNAGTMNQRSNLDKRNDRNFENNNRNKTNNQGNPRNFTTGRYFSPNISDNFIRPPAFFNKPILGLTMRPPMTPADNRPKVFNPYIPVIRYASPLSVSRPQEDVSNEVDNSMTVDDTNLHSTPPSFVSNIMQSAPSVLNSFDNKKQRNPFNDNRTVQNRGRKNNRGNRMGKYQATGQKMANVRSKAKNKKNNATILIDDSSGDEDDVIEIPMTPPPLVLIDDEDSGEENSNKNSSSSKIQDVSNRSTSPACSIISDDFIVDNDRNRVRSTSLSIMADDDLNPVQPTVDSFVNSANRISKSRSRSRESVDEETENDADSFIHPTDPSRYKVTASLIRPTDVYESESSDQQPESIYSRTAKIRRNEIDSAKDMSGIIETVDTRKKLRKRKTSAISTVGSSDEDEHASSVAPSIPHRSNEELSVDSSDDDIPICPPPPPKPNTPFIKRGVAVENNLVSQSKKKKRLTKTNSNDDFAKILSNIIEGNSNQSIDDYEVSADISLTREPEVVEDEIGDEENEIDLTLNEEDSHNGNRTEMPLVEDETNIGWNVSLDGKLLNPKEHRSAKTAHNKSDNEIDYSNRSNKYAHLRCRNCNEKGHLKKHCKVPVKIICYMCGQSGHHEPRCPDKVCLNCGNSTNSFCNDCNKCRKAFKIVCNLCKVRGHYAKSCPDLWRRYHSTVTTETPLVSDVSYTNKEHCSVCTYKGHLAESCIHGKRCLPWPPHSSRIFSHRPVYVHSDEEGDTRIATSTPQNKIGMKRKSTENTDLVRKIIRIDNEEYDVVEEIAVDDDPQCLSEKSKSQSNLVINPFARKLDKNDCRNSKKFKEFSFSKELEKLTTSDENLKKPFVLSFITDSSSKTATSDEANATVASDNGTVTNAIDNEEADLVAINTENIPSSKKDAVPEPSTSKTRQDVNVDSDSNYSFSEYYDKNKESQLANKEDTNLEISRSASPAADFISLANDEVNDEQNASSYIVMNENTENTQEEENHKCCAKIYLSKEDSQIILSPSFATTMKTLESLATVEIQMKFQATGYVLFITGLPSEQDAFHKQLLEAVQNSKHDGRRRQLEQSLQVPKAKSVLIDFIDKNLAMLKINLGNVNSLYRKMTFCERTNTKQSVKLAEKSRRVLNMILMGQYGLRDGKIHLTALQNIRKNLTSTDHLNITVELRNAIFQHIKYIFSPFEHPNYEQLLDEYHEIKAKKNAESKALEQSAPIITSETISDAEEARAPSEHWSRKCEELVEKCRKMLSGTDNQNVINKMDRVQAKAIENKLNNLDFQALLQIYNALKNKK